MDSGEKTALFSGIGIFILEAALQIGGYQNSTLSVILAIAGVACIGYAFWPSLRERGGIFSRGIRWYDRELVIRHNASGNSMLIEELAIKGMTGRKAITVDDAYALSLVTGERVPAKISGHDAKECTINPKTEFVLSADFPKTHRHSPNDPPVGFSIDDFCKSFGTFDLVLKLKSKRAYTAHFSQEEIAKRVGGLRSIGQVQASAASQILPGMAGDPVALINAQTALEKQRRLDRKKELSHIEQTQALLARAAPIDWDKWDEKNSFKLYEMACLWEGELPSLPLPSDKCRERFKALERDIDSGELKVIKDNLKNVIADAIKKTNNIPIAADPYWIVARETALEYCEKLGAEPALLYPRNRI